MMNNENLIYGPDKRVPIGMEVGGRFVWFTNAPREAVETLVESEAWRGDR
jgi:hypothetical protein